MMSKNTMDPRSHSHGSLLATSSKNIGRNKGNNYAKFAITPHRRGKVMVEKIRKETIGSWEELTK
jgi:hypothetical protein